MGSRRNRVSAIIIRSGSILLIKRIKPSETYYVLPGGGIEEGESLEEAMIREVKEETGFSVRASRELFCENHSESGENHFFLIDDFSGDEPKLGGPEAKIADENNQYILTWISRPEFEKLENFHPRAGRSKILAEWDIMAQ